MVAPPLTASVIVPVTSEGSDLAPMVQSLLIQRVRPAMIIVLDMRPTQATPFDIPACDGIDLRVERGFEGVPLRLLDILPAGKAPQLLTFIEPEDAWFPDKLQRQIALHEAQPHLGWSLSNHERITADGYTLNFLPGPARRTLRTQGYLPCFFETLPWNSFNTLSGLVVRRELLEQIPDFDLSARPSRGLDCILQIARRFPALGYLSEPLYRTSSSPDDDPSTDAKQTVLECLQRAIALTWIEFGVQYEHACHLNQKWGFELLLSKVCNGHGPTGQELTAWISQLRLPRSKRTLLQLVRLLPWNLRRRIHGHILLWHRIDHAPRCGIHAQVSEQR